MPSLAFLREARQSINRSISYLPMIIDLEIVAREFLGPVDLARAQTFYISKLTEVIMINKDENLILTAFLVGVSSLKGLNKG